MIQQMTPIPNDASLPPNLLSVIAVGQGQRINPDSGRRDPLLRSVLDHVNGHLSRVRGWIRQG
jgi:hypothetical protein